MIGIRLISTYFRYIITLAMLLPLFSSCGLFDKEIRQDKEIAAYRNRMNRILDSLSNPVERVGAFEVLIEDINTNKALITLRKKNMLLIDANTLISNIYYDIQDLDNTLKYNNIIIALDPTRASSYFYRGCTYQEFSKDSLAIIDYTQAIQLNNNYAEAFYNRGIIYEKNTRYKEALADYDQAAKLKPRCIADVYNNRGNVYLALRDTVKALNDYTTVLKMDTTNINAYTNRAGLYIKLNDMNKALVDCNKALKLDSLSVRLYRQRAEIYSAKKEYDEAIADYKVILKLDPHDKYKIREESLDSIEKLRKLDKKSSM